MEDAIERKRKMSLTPGSGWSSYRSNGLGQPDVRLTPHELYLSLGRDGGERQAAYRALFRPELDAGAVDDIRQAVQLGMPVGSGRFAEAICGRLGIRHNSGKRGRPTRPGGEADTQANQTQQDFGF
jgi:putative transposase